jgi:hypothetical protein
MSKIACVIAEDMPHHRKHTPTFFSEDDYKAYLCSRRLEAFFVETDYFDQMETFPITHHLILVNPYIVCDSHFSASSACSAALSICSHRTHGIHRKINTIHKIVSGSLNFGGGFMFRKHKRTGRPLASDSFVQNQEPKLDKILRPQKFGWKAKSIYIYCPRISN